MKFFEILNKGVNGFLTFFFILYIGKFGVSSLILEPINKWNMIFNVGVWYVITMYCLDKLFANYTKDTKCEVSE